MCYGYTRSEPSFLLEILHAAKSYILKKTERGMGMAYQAIYPNPEKSDKERQNSACISLLRNSRNRKNNRRKSFCKSGKL